MSKANILIVEDEVIIAMELQSNLESMGYQVTAIVNNGPEAINRVETDIGPLCRSPAAGQACTEAS